MKKTLNIILAMVMTLPLASFAYAEEWDEFFRDSEPKSLIDLGVGKSQPQNKVESQQRLQQVSRLDQEILILRAEMSKQNGDYKQVAQYLKQIKKQFIIPAFQKRVDRLEAYLSNLPQSPSLLSVFSFSKNIDFPMHDPSAVVAIVLPTSGRYERVGLALQNALQSSLNEAGFKGKLVALDSNLYSTAFDLWEILKYYEPDFIFGPMQKNKIQQWQELETGVATLYFNETEHLARNEYSLAPSKIAGLEQVFQVLNQAQYQNIMVLRGNDETSENVERAFNQAWLEFNHSQGYILQTINKTVGQSIDIGLKVQESKDRHRWLQSVLNQKLVFKPRVRQDIEAIISFVPETKAIQVAPYLDFLNSPVDIAHIWYPTKTPNANYLKENIDAWSQTFVILPISLGGSLEKQPPSTSKNKNGLFYALGKMAIEIVKNPSISSTVDTLIDTRFGTYVRDANGQFSLLPTVYWADNGIFEKFSIQPE
ncbi:penicillin-binding protein activator [Thiomicrorhabdus sp. Milos-T2]|uniref:penicillin-binding protein activator n=1 Tax=Thiomicrorhabdus sp. Milos-T2 TaxID=90814 RepID=UPI0004940419|nr:penicillin-binding protein activator [Thiomicrorhabdus sp. Milos-T2]